jgi:Phage tail lysozyme
MAQAVMGGLDEGQMNAQQAAGQKSANDTMAQILSSMGGTPGASSSPSTPGAAPGTAATSATPSADAQGASDEFSQSFTPQGAKAMAGVLQSESGFKTGAQGNQATDASGALSGGKGAYGIGSWNGSRQGDLAKFASDNQMDPADPDTQKLFAQWEVMNNPAYAASAKALTDPNAKPEDIASTLVTNYMRPADENVAPETSKAIALAAALRGQGAPAATAQAIAVPGYDGTFTQAQADDGDGRPSQAEWATAQKASGQVAGPGAPSNPTIPPNGQLTGNPGQLNQTAPSPSPAPSAGPGGPPAPQPGLDPKALMAVMQNPYASPAQQQMAAAMLQKTMQPKMQTSLDSSGSVWQTNPATGELSLKQDNSKDTTDAQNYETAKTTGFQGTFLDYQKASSQANKSETAKFGVIGEDQFGNKRYGFANPETGTVSPYDNGAQGGGAAGDPNMRGADFMNTLDPGTKSQVQAIIEGRAPYPTGMFLKTGLGQRIAQAVTQADPTFESGNATARVKARTEFETGAQNSPGSQIQAGNTAIDHLALLTKAADNLPSANSPGGVIGSYISGTVGKLTTAGQASTAKYNAETANFAKEMVRYLTGGEGTIADRAGIMETLSPTLTTEARKQVISGYVDQMSEKKVELQSRWHNAMGPMVPDFPTLSAPAQRSLGTISQWASPQTQGADAGGAQPASAAAAAPGQNSGGLQPGSSTVINGITIKRLN